MKELSLGEYIEQEESKLKYIEQEKNSKHIKENNSSNIDPFDKFALRFVFIGALFVTTFLYYSFIKYLPEIWDFSPLAVIFIFIIMILNFILCLYVLKAI